MVNEPCARFARVPAVDGLEVTEAIYYAKYGMRFVVPDRLPESDRRDGEGGE